MKILGLFGVGLCFFIGLATIIDAMSDFSSSRIARITFFALGCTMILTAWLIGKLMLWW